MTPGRLLGAAAGGMLVIVLALPLLALALSTDADALAAGLRSPLFGPALALSLRTTVVSLGFIVVCGTPLAWWLATTRRRGGKAVEVLVELPIVMPPAVIGVALLYTFGRSGLLGPALAGAGISLPFTEAAVIVAQIVVAAPFYVLAAANAFREIDPDLLTVARTLGASPAGAFMRVALPVALPGLAVGAALAWARALGEFGATLLFAGNLGGRTRTLPLAIFTALERDVREALVFALVLAAVAAVLLLGLRLLGRRRTGP